MSEPQTTLQPASAAWGAVISMTLGVFGLVTAEFLPVSLLTPMADDLRITEGMAGQAMSATAVMALITSLLTATVTRKIDRRYVLLGFSVLLIAANIMIALAPTFAILLAGRVLLGVALGGFWTMSAATVMRLVPEKSVPRALAILFSGVSAATVFAAPLGSYLGDVIGWRNVFLLASLLGVLALFVQFATLPKMPPRGRATLRTLIEVINRPRMKFSCRSSWGWPGSAWLSLMVRLPRPPCLSRSGAWPLAVCRWHGPPGSPAPSPMKPKAAADFWLLVSSLPLPRVQPPAALSLTPAARLASLPSLASYSLPRLSS